MPSYGPHRRKRSSKMAEAGDMREAGKSYEEIAAALGISVQTAKNYTNATTRGYSRTYRGAEPRCGCGLLLPCTCTGPMHAVDFARSGLPAAGGLLLPREAR